MTGIKNKPGGRPAKSRIDKQNNDKQEIIADSYLYLCVH